MTTVKLMAGAMALTLGLAGTVAAQPGPGGPGGPDGVRGPGGRGPGGMMGGPLGGLLGLHPEVPLPALNLTDAQEEQVRTIMQGHRDEGRALMQRAQTALDALRTATAATVDEGAAAQQGQALGAAIADAAVLRAKVRTEIYAILTPEQQAEATRIQAERHAKQAQFRTRMDQRMQQRQKKQQQQ